MVGERYRWATLELARAAGLQATTVEPLASGLTQRRLAALVSPAINKVYLTQKFNFTFTFFHLFHLKKITLCSIWKF